MCSVVKKGSGTQMGPGTGCRGAGGGAPGGNGETTHGRGAHAPRDYACDTVDSAVSLQGHVSTMTFETKYALCSLVFKDTQCTHLP